MFRIYLRPIIYLISLIYLLSKLPNFYPQPMYINQFRSYITFWFTGIKKGQIYIKDRF